MRIRPRCWVLRLQVILLFLPENSYDPISRRSKRAPFFVSYSTVFICRLRPLPPVSERSDLDRSVKSLFPSIAIGCTFEYYLSLCQGDLPKLAADFANTFHKIWWTAPQYEHSRTQFSALAGTDIEIPFKIELCKLVASYKGQNVQHAPEIELFKEAFISGIITTNWDTFLTDIFGDFQTYVGQQDRTKSRY